MFQSNLWQLNVKAKNYLWRTRNIKVRAAYIKPISMAPSRREVGERKRFRVGIANQRDSEEKPWKHQGSKPAGGMQAPKERAREEIRERGKYSD